jgi:hypothetical protein
MKASFGGKGTPTAPREKLSIMRFSHEQVDGETLMENRVCYEIDVECFFEQAFRLGLKKGMLAVEPRFG